MLQAGCLDVDDDPALAAKLQEKLIEPCPDAAAATSCREDGADTG
jgi:hypothetical protein